MKFIKIFLMLFSVSLFLTACGSTQTDDIISTNPNEVLNDGVIASENTNWARENLDLQRVGNLLEKADNPEDFEYLLNSENGINNMDLNGDGYVDYISISEFEDQGYENQRGFTLFNRFGENEIQEIARVIFDRDNYDNPGARVLLIGNEQIYGDDNYYESNWLDRSLQIAQYVFSNRDNSYQSPYYYENYPDYYETYRVVETPVYRTRIEEYYPQPVFIQTNTPRVRNVRIKSQYQDKSINKIYAKLAKPTKEQVQFIKNNPNRPEFVEVKRGKVKDVPPKFKEIEARDRNDFEKRGNGKDKNFEARNNPNRIERPAKENRAEREISRPNKPEKVERQQMKPEKAERRFEKPNKPDNPNKGGGNKGGGNGKGNGGGNGNGKGGGGGKGKG